MKITSFSSIGLIPQVDFDGTDVLLIIGANPLVSHGHLAGMPFPSKRLQDIKKRGGKVIVADPRLTKTAKVASISIQPRPGTDYAWLGYVIRELLLDENNMEGIKNLFSKSENNIENEFLDGDTKNVETQTPPGSDSDESEPEEVLDNHMRKNTSEYYELNYKILFGLSSICLFFRQSS